MSTEPKIGDSDTVLLAKICQWFSNRNGGQNPPRYADSKNRLLFKIAALVS